MKRSSWIKWGAFLLASVLLVAFVAGCGPSDEKDEGNGDEAKETIKIGLIGPMTGPNALGGDDMRNGAQLAIKEINEAGGINGHKLELIVEDDESNPAKSVAAAEKLCTQDNVALVIGSYNSSCVLANMEVTQREKCPEIDPVAVAPEVTESGNEWIFRNCATNPMQVQQLANYIKENLPELKTFAILLENTDYGVGIAEEFSAEIVKDSDCEVVAQDSYNPGDTDFYAQLTKIKNLNVDALVLGANMTEAAQITKQAKELGIKAQLFAFGGCGTQDFEMLAGDSNDGMITTSYFEIGTDNPIAKPFIEAYKAEFNKDANMISAPTYEAVYIAKAAMEKAVASLESISDIAAFRLAIRDELRALKDLPGVCGPTTFDATGQALKEVLIIQWIEGGGKNILYPQY